ncbi:MAG: ATP-binding cassette domain-containing protein [bacterium]
MLITVESLVEPMKNQTAISCRGVTKKYGQGNTAVQALRGVDLEVRLGELLMLVGPSGCGKTTLISVLAGLLQLKAHLWEFAQAAAQAAGDPPLILLGGVTPLNVRVDVDENDAWRVRAGASAVGYLRGNRMIKVPLAFVRFEPYVVPKKSLTGDSTERVDTRVLQVVFSFTRGDLPIFVGQQMDVFIDTPALPQNGSATPTEGGP